MRLVDRTKRRFFAWLSRELDQIRRRPTGSQSCVLGTGSQLSDEATIGNFAGGPERIRIGANSYVRGRIQTYGHGGQVDIGNWCYVGVRTEIWSMQSIVIGNRVMIAHDVNIHDGTAHSQDARERHQHFKDIITSGHPNSIDALPGISSSPIHVEDDVWISFGVTILKGITIGKGSIISAGSIVTKDVPPGVIYRCEVRPVVSSLE